MPSIEAPLDIGPVIHFAVDGHRPLCAPKCGAFWASVYVDTINCVDCLRLMVKTGVVTPSRPPEVVHTVILQVKPVDHIELTLDVGPTPSDGCDPLFAKSEE